MAGEPDKYVVFKRSDLPDDERTWDANPPIEDAVVIRRQDMFAAAGLRGYANAVMIALEVADMVDGFGIGTRQDLEDVLEYFLDQAAQAEGSTKIPD